MTKKEEKKPELPKCKHCGNKTSFCMLESAHTDGKFVISEEGRLQFNAVEASSGLAFDKIMCLKCYKRVTVDHGFEIVNTTS